MWNIFYQKIFKIILNLWNTTIKFFNKDVVKPIKYHVLAKRYLARDKKYFNSLSDASKISLKLQGGALNKGESKKFEKKIFLNTQ